MSTAKQEKATPPGSFFGNLAHVGLYKRNQGRIARQVTFAAIWLVLALAAWRLRETYGSDITTFKLIIPGALVAAGFWFAYRLVNLPSFADFLIGVEAEMTKVSWPTKTELYRGSMVVIFTIFFLAGLLFFYDFLWQQFFTLIDVIKVAPGEPK